MFFTFTLVFIGHNYGRMSLEHSDSFSNFFITVVLQYLFLIKPRHIYFLKGFLESGMKKSFTAVLSTAIKNIGFRGKPGFITW